MRVFFATEDTRLDKLRHINLFYFDRSLFLLQSNNKKTEPGATYFLGNFAEKSRTRSYAIAFYTTTHRLYCILNPTEEGKTTAEVINRWNSTRVRGSGIIARCNNRNNSIYRDTFIAVPARFATSRTSFNDVHARIRSNWYTLLGLSNATCGLWTVNSKRQIRPSWVEKHFKAMTKFSLTLYLCLILIKHAPRYEIQYIRPGP